MKGFVTALALMLALLLTGCGNRNGSGQPADNNTANNNTQMTEDETDRTPAQDQMENGTAGGSVVAEPNTGYEADQDGVVEDRDEAAGDRTDRGDLSDDMKDAVNDTADAAKDVTDGVANGARDVVDGVVDGARNVTDDVIDGVDDMADGARNGVEDATRESRTAR